LEVEQLLSRALAIRRSTLGASNAQTLKAISDLAEFYLLRADFEKSLTLYIEYLENGTKTFGQNSIRLVPVLQLYAANLVAIDRQIEATEIIKRVSTIIGEPQAMPMENLPLNERASDLEPMKHPSAIVQPDPERMGDAISRTIRDGNPMFSSIRTDFVSVKILVDEEGKVVEAKAENDDPDLRKAAEKAALKSLFKPFEIDGKKQKMRGVLRYYFLQIERERR
jgi:hypothetical protein